MLKGLGGIASLMQQAQEFHGRMQEIQDSLARLRVQGKSGGGMVTVEATGQKKILACEIDPSLLENGDTEMLEDLLVVAVNLALQKADDAAKDEMAKLSGNLDIPGLKETLSKLGLGGGPSG